MTDLFARKASFAAVKQDLKAVQFHKSRFENGSIDTLAKQCFQYWQQIKNHHSYKAYIQKLEDEQ